jgi:hypothetical protein
MMIGGFMTKKSLFSDPSIMLKENRPRKTSSKHISGKKEEEDIEP